MDLRILGQAAGLGLVTGLRSMMGLRMLATSAREGAFDDREGLFWSLLRSRAAVPLLSTFAAGEFVVDKVPGVPSRTSVGPLGGRLLLGALVGGAVGACGKTSQARLTGALLGAAAAAAGAFAGARTREWLQSKSILSGPIAGVIEDGIAYSLGLAVRPS